MKQILRGGILILALIGLVLGGSATVVADSHDASPSPACDALADAAEEADSHAQNGLDRANDENDCDDPGLEPIPVE